MANRTATRTVAIAAATTVAGSLPVFLVGGLSVQIRGDLHFSSGQLGIAVATYFAVSSLFSVTMGRLAQRIGLNWSLRLAATISAVALLVVAAAPDWWVLLAGLGVAGISNALGQPASNGTIVRDVPQRRRGLAFGIKQSAIPAATLLGGLAVPLIGLTVGWRWAFVLGSLGALFVAFQAGGREGSTRAAAAAAAARPLAARSLEYGPLIILSISAALAAAAAGALGTFLTASAVDTGFAEGPAGAIQAAASVFGISMRMGSGWFVDRGGREPLALVLVMLLGGAAGFGLIGLGSPPTFVAGVLLAYGLGWAWPGLFHFAISQRYGALAAAATGFTQTGVYIGGVVGPLGFGFVAETAGYGLAWGIATGFAAIAAIGIQTARIVLARRPVSDVLARGQA